MKSRERIGLETNRCDHHQGEGVFSLQVPWLCLLALGIEQHSFISAKQLGGFSGESSDASLKKPHP